jgi:hypothetical protein
MEAALAQARRSFHILENQSKLWQVQKKVSYAPKIITRRIPNAFIEP